MRSRDGQARARGLLAIGLCVLWVLLAATVFDAANEVYDGLGDSTCALKFAPSSDVPVLADSRLVADAAVTPGDAAAQACVADWKANDRARSIRVVLGELTLHLSALIAWVVLGAVGLGLLAGVGVPAVALAFGAWLARQLGRLVGAVASLVESLLGLLRAIGAGLVQLLRGLGLPAPPAPMPPAPGGRSEALLAAAGRPAEVGATDPPGPRRPELELGAPGLILAPADRPPATNGVHAAS
jgi:hypothetical protein